MAKERKAPRRNGWDCKPSFRQVISIVLTVGDGVAFFLLERPLLHGVWRQLFFVGFALSLAVTVTAAAWAMTVNPIDPKTEEEDEEVTDESEERLGDEDWWCKDCQRVVDLDSKHCHECRKCVAVYDHHCPWLNTCVGARNYAAFYTAIWALLVTLALLIASTALLLAEARNGLQGGPLHSLSEVGLLAVYIVILGVNVPWAVFVMALVSFHTYLCCQHTTTYDYYTQKITQRRQKKARQRQRQMARSRQETAPEAEGPLSFTRARLPFDGDADEYELDEDTPCSARAAVGGQAVIPTTFRSFNSSTWNSDRDLDVNRRSTASNLRRASLNLTVEDLFDAYEDTSVLGSSPSSSGDEEESQEDGPACCVHPDDVLRAAAPQDGDSELKREISFFIFGSGLDAVGTPVRRASAADLRPPDPGSGSGAGLPSS